MSPPPSVLAQQARAAREELIELIRADDPETAEWARRLGVDQSKPVVTVVGETNRGKSSLVNALLAMPGLSPVAADTATGRYLVFRHGEPGALARYLADRPPDVLDPADLAGWVLDDPPVDAVPPRCLEITVPVPLLEHLDLIDTPGVGGLCRGHDALAAEAVARCTALLFVTDASAPLSSGELGFLREAATRVDSVLFALTKIDDHPDWRAVRDADRRLLAEHAPRFAGAPIMPTSARLFESAAAVTGPTATTLREHSGIAGLQRLLCTGVGARRAMLTQANALRGLSAALDHRREVLAARGRGHEGAERWRRRRDELSAARRQVRRTGHLTLRTEIAAARVAVSHGVNHRARAVQADFRGRLDRASRRGLAAVPGQVDQALQAMAAETAAEVNARVSRITDVVLTGMFTEAERAAIRAGCLRTGTPLVRPAEPGRRPVGAEDRLLVFMGVSGGLSVGKLAAAPLLGLGVAALNPLVWPVTIGLGLGAGLWMARTRRGGVDRQHLRQWLNDVVTEARSVMERLVAEQLIHTESRLAAALDAAITARIDEIDAQLRDLGEHLRRDRAEQEAARLRDDRRLAELDVARRRCAVLLERIASLRDNGFDRQTPGADSLEPDHGVHRPTGCDRATPSTGGGVDRDTG